LEAVHLEGGEVELVEGEFEEVLGGGEHLAVVFDVVGGSEVGVCFFKFTVGT